jgi:hypothetical protein
LAKRNKTAVSNHCTILRDLESTNQEETVVTRFTNEMSVGEIRAVARRQLGGSIVAGILVVAFASLSYLSSTHSSTFVAIAHKGVRQPVFVAPSEHIIASVKQRIETP